MHKIQNASYTLRGLAILAIILHNFCHWLPNSVQANEYVWSIDNAFMFMQSLTNDISKFPINLISHYGHYGVSVFLFLSGFFLCKKYDCEKNVDKVQFIMKHAKKLWKLLLPGIFVYFVVCLCFKVPSFSLNQLFITVTFLVNLHPHRTFILGPWWWFSLMMQFYFLYIFLYHNRSNKSIVLFTALCFLFQLGVTIYNWNTLAIEPTLSSYIHYNFFCSVLPFSFGIFCARKKINWIFHHATLGISLAIVLLSSFNVFLWTIAPLAASIVFLGINSFICKNLFCKKCLCWLGNLSAWIFVLHPIIRQFVIFKFSTYTSIFVYILITLLSSYMMNKLIKWIKL